MKSEKAFALSMYDLRTLCVFSVKSLLSLEEGTFMYKSCKYLQRSKGDISFPLGYTYIPQSNVQFPVFVHKEVGKLIFGFPRAYSDLHM